MIIRDEGPDNYHEYLRNVFRSYMTCSDEEFVETIKAEKRKWMQGQLGQHYNYTNLLDLGRTTYNNLVADNEWTTVEPKKSKGSGESGQEKQFLALATEILTKMKDQNSSSGDKTVLETNSDGGIKLKNGRELKAWRFQNPNNEKTKTLKDGTVMKWCTNNCHPKPMWCGRKNCLNREEYAAKFGDKNKSNERVENKSDNVPSAVSEDFKIALAAMTSNQDFETLKAQFFPGK